MANPIKPNRSPGELLDQSARRAEDELEKMGDGTTPYVASSVEQNAEADEKLAKAEEMINDKYASSAIIRQLAAMQEMLNLHQKLLMEAVGKRGYAPLEQEEEKKIVTAPHVPIDAVISIYIPEGTTAHEREPIPVFINGDGRFLKRGEFIQVTRAELEVLQNAVYEGEELPAVNDVPLAATAGKAHMALSRPIKYRRARYPIMVNNIPYRA